VEIQTRLLSHPARAFAWMLAAQVFFALMAVGARIGGRALPWQEVCASRFIFGGLTVFVAARLQGQSLRVLNVRAARWRSAYGTLSAAGTFYLYATPKLPIGDAATLLATAPLFVAVLGIPILGEPVRGVLALALVGGFAGIGLVAEPSFASSGLLVALGTATALASALAFIALRRVGPGESSEAVVFHFAVVGSVTMLLACIPVWRLPNVTDGVALLATGIFGGFAQIMMTRAYALDNAARVSALGYSGVVFTRALAVPLFGELPSAMRVAGSLLVVASGVAIALSSSSDVCRRSRTDPGGPADGRPHSGDGQSA
jgi:drug/metabolite transporter (DMT)-like permease